MMLAVYNGKAFCYERHLQRFKNSAERYGLSLSDPNGQTLEIQDNLQNAIIPNAFVWFLAWRGYPIVVTET